MNVIVTGSAGFIGYHLSNKLIKEGFSVCGLDNLNNYYDVSLKNARLKRLMKYEGEKNPFTFSKTDITNKKV